MEWQELLQEVQVGAFPLLEGLFEAMAIFNRQAAAAVPRSY